MRPLSAKREFQNYVTAAGRSLNSLTPAEGIEMMLRFYQEVRADGCKMGEDGDMLLYQWGCYHWSGEAEIFDVDITRQFVFGEGEDGDIFQLSLTFRFEPTAALREIGSESRWCPSLDEAESFRAFIYNSPAYRAVAQEKPVEISFEFDCVG